MAKIVILLALSLSIILHVYAQVPELFCDHSQKPGDCFLTNVYLLRDQPRYKLQSTLKYEDVETVAFYNQKLAIMSPDFCEAFPRLWSLYAASNKIEIVDRNAFSSCYNIRSLDISDNIIQILPGDLFRNNFKLSFLNLQVNKIGYISNDQFDRNFNLEYIFLGINELQGFPAEAVKNCRKLKWLLIYTNNIYDLDSKAILANCPVLSEAMLNGNMMPCSRIREMVADFEAANVLLDEDYVSRDRPFRMGEVNSYSCVDAQ